MASRSTRLRFNIKAAAQRLVTCETYKVTHRTRAAADAAVERAMNDGDVHPGCHLVAYRCEQCQHWHVANRVVVFREEQ